MAALKRARAGRALGGRRAAGRRRHQGVSGWATAPSDRIMNLNSPPPLRVILRRARLKTPLWLRPAQTLHAALLASCESSRCMRDNGAANKLAGQVGRQGQRLSSRHSRAAWSRHDASKKRDQWAADSSMMRRPLAPTALRTTQARWLLMLARPPTGLAWQQAPPWQNRGDCISHKVGQECALNGMQCTLSRHACRLRAPAAANSRLAASAVGLQAAECLMLAWMSRCQLQHCERPAAMHGGSNPAMVGCCGSEQKCFVAAGFLYHLPLY